MARALARLALRPIAGAAHEAPVPAERQPEAGRREGPMETVVGIVLILIAAFEIWFIVRTVQANMPRS